MGWDTPDRLAQRVALEVLLQGPLSRSELAERLGLARATLTRISAELIDRGVLVEAKPVGRRRQGRPTVPLDVVRDAHHFVGIKLAADRITGVVTNLKAEVIDTFEADLPGTAPKEVLGVIEREVMAAALRTPVSAVGIGIGAVVTEEGVVTSAAFLGWSGVPLTLEVRRRTGLPTFAANDLAAFTEAQHWFGAGLGRESFAAITLGAGVGYGCVANGRLLAGSDYGLGLVGHWPLDPLGPLCSRGHRGCAEGMLTIPAMERDVSSVLGREVAWSEIIRMGREGEPGVTRVLNASGRALGRLIAAVANLVAPELVVIGGEGVELAELTTAAVHEGIREHRDPRAQQVEVVFVDGDNIAWCRGAAVIAIQGFVTEPVGT